MDTNRDERLRLLAYRIWESEGRPDGMDAGHWARAEHELAGEEAGAPAPASRPKKARPDEAAPGVVPDVRVKKKKKKAAADEPKSSRKKKG